MMSPFESTRRLLTTFPFAPLLPERAGSGSASTGATDDFDQPPPLEKTTGDGHEVTYSVELEPWPTKSRTSEDSDAPSAASSTEYSGSFADRLAELPSYQPRQRFPTPSIRSGISRTHSISSNVSSIIGAGSDEGTSRPRRNFQRRASEDAWRQFWD